MQDSTGAVTLASLGSEMASHLGIDTSPVDGSGLPVFDESLFFEIYNPNPMGDMSAPGKRWIEVSISEQRLYAYQGNTLISTTLVSTGIPPNNTEQGVFHVRYKLEKTDMTGITDSEWSGDRPRGRRRASRDAVRRQGCSTRDVLQLRRRGVARRLLAQQFRHADESRLCESTTRYGHLPLRLGTTGYDGLGSRLILSGQPARNMGWAALMPSISGATIVRLTRSMRSVE